MLDSESDLQILSRELFYWRRKEEACQSCPQVWSMTNLFCLKIEIRSWPAVFLSCRCLWKLSLENFVLNHTWIHIELEKLCLLKKAGARGTFPSSSSVRSVLKVSTRSTSWMTTWWFTTSKMGVGMGANGCAHSARRVTEPTRFSKVSRSLIITRGRFTTSRTSRTVLGSASNAEKSSELCRSSHPLYSFLSLLRRVWSGPSFSVNGRKTGLKIGHETT